MYVLINEEKLRLCRRGDSYEKAIFPFSIICECILYRERPIWLWTQDVPGVERSARSFTHNEPSLFQHPSLTLQKIRSFERGCLIAQFSLTWLVYVHQLSLFDHGVMEAGNRARLKTFLFH